MEKKSHSFTTILITVLTFVCTLAFSLSGLIIGNRMDASIRTASNNYCKVLIEQVESNLNHFFKGVDNTLYTLMSNTTLIDALNDFDSMDSYAQLLERKNINHSISSLMKSHDEISNFFILTQDTVFALNPTSFQYTEFTRELLARYPAQQYIIPTYYPIDYPDFVIQDTNRKEMVITLPIRDYQNHSTQNSGLIIATINTNDLDKLFIPLKQKGFEISILDENNTVYYSSDTSTWNTPYNFDDFHELQAIQPLSVHGWQVVITSELPNMYHQIAVTQRMIASVTFAAIILITILILFVSQRITYPLKMLTQQMSVLDYGHLSTKLHPVHSYQEIDFLYNGYNRMLNRIQSLIDTVSFERLRQKEAQFEALQSKINPHFLYNTLQSIYSLAILERNEDVGIVTIALSDMLKYITYGKSEQVPLSQELTYINNYLEIQRRRRNDKFVLEYHIDKSAERCLINKLMVQPIVENAINHGFHDLTENGLLIISANIDGNDLVVTITDNGAGINSETLSLLRERLANPDIDSAQKSIGLINIQERIHLKYGKEYGLTVNSSETEGTRITLRIPTRYEEENYETKDFTN